MYISTIMSVCPSSEGFGPFNLKICTASNSEIEDRTENPVKYRIFSSLKDSCIY